MPADTKDLSCAECAAVFKTQEELDNHNRNMHGKGKTAGSKEQTPQKRTA